MTRGLLVEPILGRPYPGIVARRQSRPRPDPCRAVAAIERLLRLVPSPAPRPGPGGFPGAMRGRMGSTFDWPWAISATHGFTG